MSESKSIKYFTPNEARRTLPLVKKIVKDILSCGFELKTIADSSAGDIEGNEEFQTLSEQMQSYFNELQEIGCMYKDWSFNIGLVDFPAIIYGEQVLLCWRSDEDEIRFYHGLLDGFAGRKEIPAKYFEKEERPV